MRALLVLLLAGCSSFDSDEFCTLFVNDSGVKRCVAWQIGPTKAQERSFDHLGPDLWIPPIK